MNIASTETQSIEIYLSTYKIGLKAGIAAQFFSLHRVRIYSGCSGVENLTEQTLEGESIRDDAAVRYWRS